MSYTRFHVLIISQRVERSINSDNRVFLSSVAYSNCDNPDGDEKLTWSTASNTRVKMATHAPELTGYIKDSAWDYEREIRIKAVLGEGHNFSRVAIDIPDYVFNSMKITAGPLFEGVLEGVIKEEIRRSTTVVQSLFFKKLNIDTGCSKCPYKAKEEKGK